MQAGRPKRRYFFSSARLVGLPVVEPAYAPKTYTQTVLAALYNELSTYPDDDEDEDDAPQHVTRAPTRSRTVRDGSADTSPSPVGRPYTGPASLLRPRAGTAEHAAALAEQKRSSLAKARAAKAAKAKARAEMIAAGVVVPSARPADGADQTESRLRKRARVNYAEDDGGERQRAPAVPHGTHDTTHGHDGHDMDSPRPAKPSSRSPASPRPKAHRVRLKDMIHDPDPAVARAAQARLDAKRRSVANARLAKAAKAARMRAENAEGGRGPADRRSVSGDSPETDDGSDDDSDDDDAGSDGGVSRGGGDDA